MRRRLLLLHAQLGDPFAQRIQALLDGEARLLDRAQPLGHVLEPPARIGERALALGLHGEGLLQPLAHVALVELAELRRGVLAGRGERGQPLAQRHHELRLRLDLVARAALLEARLGQRPLGIGDAAARCVERRLRGLRRVLERLHALHDLLDPARAFLHRVLRLLHLQALAALLLLDLRQLGADRLAPARGLLRALLQLQVFHLERMVALASALRLLGEAPRLLPRRAHFLLEARARRLLVAARAGALRNAAAQLLDLALALQHAVQLRLRTV
jgi:hypothetical protein